MQKTAYIMLYDYQAFWRFSFFCLQYVDQSVLCTVVFKGFFLLLLCQFYGELLFINEVMRL